MNIRLSERQEATVAAAVTVLAGVVLVAATGALGWFLAAFFRHFSGVFLPLATAAVGALVFKPYYEWLQRRARLPRALAVVAVFLSVIVPVAGFFWFFGALLTHQVTDLVERIPAWWRGAMARLEAEWPQIVAFFAENPFGQKLRQAAEEGGGEMAAGLQAVGLGALGAGAALFRFVGGLLGWAVAPVYFAFFLMTDPGRFRDVEHHLPFLKAETRRDLVYLGRQFVDIVVAFFRGQLIVAFLGGLCYALGFTAVGLRFGFILGLALGFLNIIPYLGSMVGLAAALPLAFFQEGGGWSKLLWVLAVFFVVQMIEGYLLVPKVMGDRTGLHPMAIIIAVFFWGAALDGLMGMILAIPLTAFLVVFWRLARDKYMTELV